MPSYNPHTGQKIDCCPENVPVEMPTLIVRERWFICMKCEHFNAGMCDLISVDLAQFSRKVTSKCPISESPSGLPKW